MSLCGVADGEWVIVGVCVCGWVCVCGCVGVWEGQAAGVREDAE
jgi:hypothetical protein